MAYAQITDLQSRIARTMSPEEQTVASSLLDDAAVIIDNFNEHAKAESKKVVSCRMVIRALGDGQSSGVPVGASQGSMSALGYSQSWTMGNGSTGELYLSKLDKQILGYEERVGSYSPVEELVRGTEADND